MRLILWRLLAGCCQRTDVEEATRMPTVDLTDAPWRKSSFSGGEGSNGACVEVAWRKSSYSGGSGSNGDCVEVAFAGPAVAIRDSKAPASGALAVPARSWRAFTAQTRIRRRVPLTA